jgi:hypothetical protein
MFCRSLFVLLSFFLFVIVLSVLRFMASSYHFGIFKLFLALLVSLIYCLHVFFLSVDFRMKFRFPTVLILEPPNRVM